MKNKKKQVLFTIILLTLNFLPTTISAQPIEEIQKLLASDGNVEDEFAYSVSISGNYAIVGSFRDDDNGSNSGSAYIYYNNSGIWEQQAKIKASDGAIDDYFGMTVCISGDYVIVGARQDDDNGTDSGSAYIFYNNSGTWEQQAKLLASDGAEGDRFGSKVHIFGNYVIVAAKYDDDNGQGSGSAYIFYNNSSTWEQQAKLLASDGSESDTFGYSVSMSDEYAIVGALGDDENGSYSGSAYIFKKPVSGWSNMTETVKLLASDGSTDDNFGISVDISGDYVIVGAGWYDGVGIHSGAAYIFYNNSGSWEEQTKLTASDSEGYDFFGTSVGISDDYAIVGAWGDDDNGSHSGSAYIFHNNSNIWEEQSKFTASDGAEGDSFGISVSISVNNAIIGANKDADNGENSGSAYIFGQPSSSISCFSDYGITIYPNPVNDKFTIITDDNYEIIIMDISGKIVNEKKINAGQTTFNLTDNTSGVYFIIIKNDKSVITEKIVKK